MVVLAVTLCTRSGKLLMSRQFVEMTRIRIEGLVAAFPKLLGGVGKQHTFVETENVRYVYQPLEAFYLVLITSKQSNIVEDLETLKLISKLVPEYCPHDEDAIRSNPFEFIFAIDEVISLGYREQVSLSQVKTSMEMASHEYRLSVLIKEGKEEDAKAHMARKIEEMERRKADARRAGGTEFGAGGGFGGGAPPSQPQEDIF